MYIASDNPCFTNKNGALFFLLHMCMWGKDVELPRAEEKNGINDAHCCKLEV